MSISILALLFVAAFPTQKIDTEVGSERMMKSTTLDRFEETYSSTIGDLPLPLVLLSPMVMDELEVSQKQGQEIRRLVVALQEERKRQRQDKLRQSADAATSGADKSPLAPATPTLSLEEILLDHQLLRLRQLRAQLSCGINQRNAFGLADFFDLEESVAKKLAALDRRYQQELATEAVELRASLTRLLGEMQKKQLAFLSIEQRLLFDRTFGKLHVPDYWLEQWIALLLSTHQLGQMREGGSFNLSNAEISLDVSLSWFLPRPDVVQELDMDEEQQLQVVVLLGLKQAEDREKSRKMKEGLPVPATAPFMRLELVPFTPVQAERYRQLFFQDRCGMNLDPLFGLNRLVDFLEIDETQLKNIRQCAEQLPAEFREEIGELLNRFVDIRNRQLIDSLALVPDQVQKEFREIFGEVLLESGFTKVPGVIRRAIQTH